ncbi:hypothetical protein GSI_03554 [Ganoderma sinense ZZ0214-1]|uniref:Enoyl reductase (ER) domain-containing protein n=1 Tax=Ganoderma sinense ZZ0214-1 TaxID=1077348 RepID=A0A2G8SJX7_9APHY|nr:hypothetical protein GSI_03554 [Ganoderma sinense ZZ0214-1]
MQGTRLCVASLCSTGTAGIPPAVLPLPPSVPPLVGAASLVQGLTALTFASEAYDVRRGDRVLVHTVAGGLGL